MIQRYQVGTSAQGHIVATNSANGKYVLYADHLAKIQELRYALGRICNEMECIHEAACAINAEDVRCLIRTSEGEEAVKQARKALEATSQ